MRGRGDRVSGVVAPSVHVYPKREGGDELSPAGVDEVGQVGLPASEGLDALAPL